MPRVFNLQKFLIQWLRRGSYRTPARQEVKKGARIARGLYQCAKCMEAFRNGQFAIDHKKPVVDPKRGFVDFNEYIDRLYCAADGLQVLCKDCHKAKSNKENKKRRNAR